MPSSKNYKTKQKFCEACGEPLSLNNARDLVRKKYCSNSCRGKTLWVNRQEEEKLCPACEEKFYTKLHYQVYCSKDCHASGQVSRSYKMLNDNPEKYFQHALYKKGRELLTVDFMLEVLERQEGRCAISGQKLTFIKIPGNGRVHTNAAIDQIVAGGGYTEDNVQLLCDTVNRMKSDMTETELKFWCRAILEG